MEGSSRQRTEPCRALTGCATHKGGVSTAQLRGGTLGTVGSCVHNGNGTPGALMAGITVDVVCHQSTRERRHVAPSVHREAFAEYGPSFPKPLREAPKCRACATSLR